MSATDLHAIPKKPAKIVRDGTAPRGLSTPVAVEKLRDMITSGELPPGSRITERAISDHLNLSRTPLREAIKILESEELVVLVPHRGAFVPLLTEEEVDEAMSVLMALEALAAPLVCSRMTTEQLAQIETLHESMIAHYEAGELMPYFAINQDIHRAIIDASGSHTLSRIYGRESGRIQRYRFAGNCDVARWRRAVYEHELILDALRQRDGELLKALLQAHLRSGWNVARKRLGESAS